MALVVVNICLLSKMPFLAKSKEVTFYSRSFFFKKKNNSFPLVPLSFLETLLYLEPPLPPGELVEMKSPPPPSFFLDLLSNLLQRCSPKEGKSPPLSTRPSLSCELFLPCLFRSKPLGGPLASLLLPPHPLANCLNNLCN